MKWTEEDVRKWVRIVRDKLESGEITDQMFDMNEVFSCGSIGCIGGWAVALRSREDYKDRNWDWATGGNLRDMIVAFGGSDEGNALNLLFFKYPKHATRAQAVRAIDAWFATMLFPWDHI